MLQQQIAGKYELLGQLEDEGSAEVYKVRHLFLEEVRLIKVVHPPSLAMTEEVTERFLREARAAIKLRHPNIAQLHDFTIDEEGTAFIVTELIEGLTLEEALAEEGPPPVELTLTLACQALRALGYLHRAGMVHRDISPDKLMLTRDVDGRALVKWVDLGTSQVLAAGDGLSSGVGVFPGRPRYASPEQFGAPGEGPVDARSDLYSFGVVLYELLTGRCPIGGKDSFSLMVGHLSAPPLSFDESDPEGRVPAGLRDTVLAALAKKPTDRIASAEELTRRLTALQDPLADDRGEYLDRVLRQARQRRAVVIPAPAPVASPPVVARPVVASPVIPSPRPEPPAAPPKEVKPPAPALPEPRRPVEPPASVMDPVLSPRPSEVRTAGVDWDQQNLAFATQALRIDPPPAAEEKKETLPEPAPSPTPPAVSEPERPRPKLVLMILGGLVLAAVFVGTGWWLGGSGRSEEPAASTESSEATPAPTPPPVETIEVKEEPTPETALDPTPPPARPARQEKPRRTTETSTSSPLPPLTERRVPVVAPPVPAPPAAEPEAPVDTEVVPSQPGRGSLIMGGPGVETAEVTFLGQAVYPERARGTGKQASIKVAVLVDENGNVIQARVKEGDPSRLGFNEAAVEAARKTRFLPATKDGVPGKSWNDLIFEFADPGVPPN